jgi:hypothetical protein
LCSELNGLSEIVAEQVADVDAESGATARFDHRDTGACARTLREVSVAVKWNEASNPN